MKKKTWWIWRWWWWTEKAKESGWRHWRDLGFEECIRINMVGFVTEDILRFGASHATRLEVSFLIWHFYSNFFFFYKRKAAHSHLCIWQKRRWNFLLKRKKNFILFLLVLNKKKSSKKRIFFSSSYFCWMCLKKITRNFMLGSTLAFRIWNYFHFYKCWGCRKNQFEIYARFLYLYIYTYIYI